MDELQAYLASRNTQLDKDRCKTEIGFDSKRGDRKVVGDFCDEKLAVKELKKQVSGSIPDERTADENH